MTIDRWEAGDAYEAFMGRWSRRLAQAFLTWLQPAPALHWLDVGCGPGALTSAICNHANPASVLGCDLSAPFVEHARQRVQHPAATFAVAGAGDLPRRDDGFDAVVSGLVLNFTPDPVAALAAMQECARAGGIVSAYVWDYADGMQFLRVFWDEVVALDPNAASQDEGRRFPLCREPALRAAFDAAGFDRVTTTALELDTVFANFDDYWAPFLQGTGPAPGYVASLDDAAREALKSRLRHRLHTDPDGRVYLRARAWCACGNTRSST
jgi:SAM-dependent methyltransferase